MYATKVVLKIGFYALQYEKCTVSTLSTRRFLRRRERRLGERQSSMNQRECQISLFSREVEKNRFLELCHTSTVVGVRCRRFTFPTMLFCLVASFFTTIVSTLARVSLCQKTQLLDCIFIFLPSCTSFSYFSPLDMTAPRFDPRTVTLSLLFPLSNFLPTSL